MLFSEIVVYYKQIKEHHPWIRRTWKPVTAPHERSGRSGDPIRSNNSPVDCCSERREGSVMKIYTIRERPDLIPAMLESLEAHWPACMPWIKKHMEKVLADEGPVPDAWIAVEDGKIVGGYTLAIKELLYSQDRGLWIATLYMDPAFRGKHLSPILIEHARRRGGELGYEKIYLATEHTNYYEKYGFYTIGPDACAWGEPTQMFENTTLPPKKEGQAA